jgi:hypothetical protein
LHSRREGMKKWVASLLDAYLSRRLPPLSSWGRPRSPAARSKQRSPGGPCRRRSVPGHRRLGSPTRARPSTEVRAEAAPCAGRRCLGVARSSSPAGGGPHRRRSVRRPSPSPMSHGSSPLPPSGGHSYALPLLEMLI